MAAVQLADGVWRVPTAPADLVNSYLLAEPDGSLTVVDAGIRNAHRRLLAALAQLGKAPGDVQRILLTHTHSDHAGGLAGVQKATGARVLVHELEAPNVIAGRVPRQERALPRLLFRLPGAGFTPSVVDGTWSDGDVLPVGGGVTVVHTPGHSPGHCSLLHGPSGVLITGDAIFNVRGLRYSPKTFCSDIRLSRETAARLGDLDFDVAAFTHGVHIASGARQAVRAFVAGRPR